MRGQRIRMPQRLKNDTNGYFACGGTARDHCRGPARALRRLVFLPDRGLYY